MTEEKWGISTKEKRIEGNGKEMKNHIFFKILTKCSEFFFFKLFLKYLY